MNNKSMITRRKFLRWTGGSTAGVFMLPAFACSKEVERPNILWITCEDASANLDCYGDEYAITPNLDNLSAKGFRYTNAFSHAGVCAPSRYEKSEVMSIL